MSPGEELYLQALQHLHRDELDEALALARQALDIDGNNPAFRETLARILYRSGDLAATITEYETLLRNAPHHLPTLKRLGRLLVENWQFERADDVLAQAIALDPADDQLRCMQVFAKNEMGECDLARRLASDAASAFPDNLQLALDSRLLLPMINTDASALGAARQRYADGVSELARAPGLRWTADQVFRLERSNFLLAYQGRDDRQLQSLHADFIGKQIRVAAPELVAARKLHFDGTRRLRVGFISNWVYACTVGNYFERWMTGLDAARFERFVYYTGQAEDQLTRRVARACDHFVRLNAGVRENGVRMLADRLDILIHPEVGMSTASHLYAGMRLAPLQMAGWGHPVTTGSAEIDYFLSCREMEPDGATDHYREKLLLLDGIGVDFPAPPPVEALDRSALGLPAAAHLYFCPQSLFKIHPDMDDALAGILAADAAAVLVFFQAASRKITMDFAARQSARIARAGIRAQGQIKFLPRLDAVTFRRALATADVVLDTIHWSGGGTSLDAFAAGVPVVTLPGRFMRGRQTAAMLRMMGLEQLIAVDIDDYVAKATELAGNGVLSRSVRDAIARNRGQIFDRPHLTRDFADRIYEVAIAQSP